MPPIPPPAMAIFILGEACGTGRKLARSGLILKPEPPQFRAGIARGRFFPTIAITNLPNSKGYDLWSATYDRYPNPTVAMDERHFPPRWRHLEGGRVLEVGCGTGRHTAKLAAQGNEVTGIDLSAGMLAAAREKLRGFPRVRLLQGDILTVAGLEDGAFDALVAALVLEHLRDLAGFFGRARSILRPGGEAHFSEIHPARASQGVLAHFKTEGGEQVDLDSIPHPEGAIEGAARAAGFALADVQDALGDEELAGLNPKWSRYAGIPMIRMWRFERLG
jgi:SAM-dependent methyltransferase